MFKKKRNNNTGIYYVSVGILILLILGTVVLLTDVINISRKRHAFNRQINYVARVVARQGGSRSYKPDWIDRLDYETSGDLYDLTKELLLIENIPEEDWDIHIGRSKNIEQNPKLIASLNNEFDFGDDIYIQGKLRYEWPVAGSFLSYFKDRKPEYTYVRKVASEAWNRHKDDDNWLDNVSYD